MTIRVRGTLSYLYNVPIQKIAGYTYDWMVKKYKKKFNFGIDNWTTKYISENRSIFKAVVELNIIYLKMLFGSDELLRMHVGGYTFTVPEDVKPDIDELYEGLELTYYSTAPKDYEVYEGFLKSSDQVEGFLSQFEKKV